MTFVYENISSFYVVCLRNSNRIILVTFMMIGKLYKNREAVLN